MSTRILVIDDEEDVRLFLKAVLEDAGFVVVTATDGVEGLALAKQDPPDLVTLDLQMPNKTGTEFYRRLARDNDLKAIPVIVVSGLAGRHLAVKEPAAVFDKPIDPAEFVATVREVLAG